MWRITHRCHKKEFLLKFAKDRQDWLNRLFEAKNRHGIIILDYMYSSDILLKYLTILDQPLF
ncbi:MAG: transposase, partial [bacterium]